MIRLALGQLRHRTIRYLALLLAIIAAVAVTTATAGITRSLTSTVNDLFERPYAQSDVVISIHTASDINSEIDQLRTLPGITDVTFDHITWVPVRGLPDRPNALEMTPMAAISDGPSQWRTVIDGHLPTAPGEVATSDKTPLGTVLSAQAAADEPPLQLTVVGHVQASAAERFTNAGTIFALPQQINDLSGRSTIGELRIATDDSLTPTDAVARITAESSLPASAIQSIATAQDHATTQANQYLGKRQQYFLLLSLFLAVVAAVSALVIFSTFMVVIAPRQREYALLQSLGATSGQIRGMVTLEALILSAVGVVIGLPLGRLLGGALAENADKFGVSIALTQAPASIPFLAVVALSAVIVTVMAALPAVRSALKGSLVTSLSAESADSTHPAVRVLLASLGIVIAAAGAVATTLAPATGEPIGRRAVLVAVGSNALIIAGVCLFLAVAIPTVLALVARLGGGFLPTQPHLGLAFTAKQRRRSAAIVLIVTAGSALIATVFAGQAALSQRAEQRATADHDADIVITAVDDTLPEELVTRLREIPGVAATVNPAVTSVTHGDDGDTAIVLPDAEAREVLRAEASDEIIGPGPGEVVLGTYSSLRKQLQPGSHTVSVLGRDVTVTIRHGVGTRTLIAPDVVEQAQQSLAESKGIPRDQLPPLPHPVLLIRADGPGRQGENPAIVQRLSEALVDQPASLTDRFGAREKLIESSQRLLTMSTLLTIAAVLIAGLGVANSVALAVSERARDRFLLGSIGLTNWGYLSALGTEIIALALPASVIGSLVGAISGRWIGVAITEGGAQVTTPEWTLVALVSAGALATVLLFSALALLRRPARSNA